MSAVTTRRHFALRHRLGPAEAREPATPAWVTERIHHYAAAVGVAVSVLIDVDEYQARTGRRVSERCWGDADWAGAERLVYVDPSKCATKGRAELVIAHEVGHHAWRSYRHRVVFWARVQALLDRVGGRPADFGEAALGAGETSQEREEP